MKRILFISIPEKGHLNPMIGPGVYLRDRGHTVAFFASRDVSAQLRAAGLDSVPEMLAQLPPAAENRGDVFARKVRTRDWLRGWIKQLLVEQAEEQIEPLRKVIRNFQPDVVVVDPMIYAAIIAAHEEELPWVALSNSLNPVLDESVHSELIDTLSWLAPERARFFNRHGLNQRFSGCDAISPWLTVAFATEEFIGRAASGIRMVGPSFPPGSRGDEAQFQWNRLRNDVPKVYLSFGSQLYHQPGLFRRVIEATGGLGVQLVIAAQQLYDSPDLGALPEHVLACGYAPQLSLLPRVNVFVTHGGANSVMEALRFGVPLLVSPVCNDQFHQAHYVRQSGVGMVLDLQRAGVTECRAALEKLLNDTEIKAQMKRVSASYQRDGAAEAASLIEGVA
jgi:UDP:flavonoid glycosyltransferase YjiC (YdhE family)